MIDYILYLVEVHPLRVVVGLEATLLITAFVVVLFTKRLDKASNTTYIVYVVLVVIVVAICLTVGSMLALQN